MKNILNITSYLAKAENKLTIRQLSIKSKTPYTTTLRTINKNKELFQIEKIGNQKIITLNFKNPLLKNYLAISEHEKSKTFLKNHKKISILKKQLPNKNYTAILFGSRANEENRDQSDVDILILTRKPLKEKINFEKSELLLKLDINPIFMLEKEFQEMLKEKEENLAKQVIRNHIILKNENKFWDIALNE